MIKFNAYRILALSMLMLLGSVSFNILFADHSFAADARNYNAGKIIDDVIFTNSDSMSVQDIQNFLKSKVSCDTNGVKRSELGGGTRAQWMNSRGIYAPFRCITDYYENPTTGENNYSKNTIPAGAISAAQIIYNYSRQFSINPQVIIVTLQKENGLITDEWPTPKQFSEAMGFGCPDNVAPGAPACDPSYGSFSAQIYQAARHFRGYINNQSGWYVPFNTGNNNIRWSPNSSCGSSTVNIENRATVALYSYTPYQPNQAAKNAQYGTGDGCSAYGNRNFYLYFTDWFGQTVGVQDLISDGVSGIYYVSNGYKYYIPTMAEFYNYGYRDSDIGRINRVSTANLNAIPNNNSIPNISVIQASANQGIYIISDGLKYYIPSMDVFNKYGFRESDIMLVTETSLNRYRTADKPIGNFVSDSSGFAYRVEDGKRRGIFQPWVLNEYPDANTNNQLSGVTLNRIAVGVPITKGKLALQSGNQLFLSVNSKWFAVPSKEVATCGGAEGFVTIEAGKTVADVSAGVINSCFVKDQNGQKYLLDGTLQYAIQDNDEIQYSPINTSTGIANFPIEPYSKHKNLFATDKGIFKLEAGAVRHVMSIDYVQELTGTDKVKVLNTDSIKSLTKGPNRYSTGSLIAGTGRGINVVINDKVSYISSMDQFYAYGFNINNVAVIGDSEVNKQISGSNLPTPKVKCNSQYYVISGGYKLNVSATLLAQFGGANSFEDIECDAIAKLSNGTMTRFVTSPNNKNIYYIENGMQRHILAWQKFLDLGGNLNNITMVDNYTLDNFPVGDNI